MEGGSSRWRSGRSTESPLTCSQRRETQEKLHHQKSFPNEDYVMLHSRGTPWRLYTSISLQLSTQTQKWRRATSLIQQGSSSNAAFKNKGQMTCYSGHSFDPWLPSSSQRRIWVLKKSHKVGPQQRVTSLTLHLFNYQNRGLHHLKKCVVGGELPCPLCWRPSFSFSSKLTLVTTGQTCGPYNT